MPSDSSLDKHWRIAQPDLARAIDDLLQIAGGHRQNDFLYREMIRTVVRMHERQADRWDAKIVANTVREMEAAFARLAHFHHQRKVTVFGSARAQPGSPIYQLARDLAAHLVEDDYMVITGAGPGVMQAANEGAGREQSIGLNINLPFEQEANPVMQGALGLLEFRFFFVRKLFFVREADAVAVFPGGFGTLDEALELKTLVQTGKSPVIPILLVDVPGGSYWQRWLDFVREELLANGYISEHDMALFRVVTSTQEACEEITRFYRNYHSSRWVDDQMILRLGHDIPAASVEDLADRFSSLCVRGRIHRCSALEAEEDEPELADLPRIAFHFNQRDFGKLRELIDAINASPRVHA